MDELTSKPIVQAPYFPTYSKLAFAIQTFADEPFKLVRGTIREIWDQTGTPQDPVDWSDPDTWIDERLSGDSRTFAHKVWSTSQKTLNPRHLTGCYLFINRMNLLDRDAGYYRLGERGRRFLSHDEGILRELDAAEGIPKALSLVAERSPAKHGDLLPEWSDYLKGVSVFTTSSTFRDSLRRRLANLVDRGLVGREGNWYSITRAGLEWLKGFTDFRQERSAATPSQRRTTVAEAAQAHNDEQVVALRARLMQLEPTQFEHFIKELLDAMDYEDIQVTKVTGDKGVDVIGRIQIGITEVTEVVQVKRTETTIHRPKVDELRGALPYHKAIRGTIISLGSFTAGAKEGALFPGAAPITLIDGKRLLELCVKHEVGVKRRAVEIYEIDEAFFTEHFEDEDTQSGPIANEPETEQ